MLLLIGSVITFFVLGVKCSAFGQFFLQKKDLLIQSGFIQKLSEFAEARATSAPLIILRAPFLSCHAFWGFSSYTEVQPLFAGTSASLPSGQGEILPAGSAGKESHPWVRILW